MLTLPQIRNLPKIDLHRHLDCSMRWSTLSEIANSLGLHNQLGLPLERNHYLVTNQMKNLEEVLNKFLTAQKVLASEEILTRLAFEVCEDAFNDNIQLLELRYAPSFISNGHSHLKFDRIHQCLMKGVQMAESKFKMAVGLIGIIQRIKSVSQAESIIDFFIDHKSDYVGVDLADNEEGFDPKPFAHLFQKAKKSGLHVTIHSGEASSPLAGRWILDSIDLLGAERIGHGVQCIHHEDVKEILKKKQIMLEVCPLSNWLTQAFPTFESHPVKKLYDQNIPLTINSDDPGIFGSTLSDDYQICQSYHGFNELDFKKMNTLAYQKSFLPESKKAPWKGLFT
jgi:adenosine deaminase